MHLAKFHESAYHFGRSVRFTQQLVLFAPQAVTVHSHVLNLLPTLSSRQVTTLFNELISNVSVLSDIYNLLLAYAEAFGSFNSETPHRKGSGQ